MKHEIIIEDSTIHSFLLKEEFTYHLHLFVKDADYPTILGKSKEWTKMYIKLLHYLYILNADISN
jgi:hypothetical protein